MGRTLGLTIIQWISLLGYIVVLGVGLAECIWGKRKIKECWPALLWALHGIVFSSVNALWQMGVHLGLTTVALNYWSSGLRMHTTSYFVIILLGELTKTPIQEIIRGAFRKTT